MKLISVNVSLPKEVPHRRETVSTGIFKEPVGGRIMLRTTNLAGDGQADLENHGGVDRAAYAYSVENYDHWRHELGWHEFFKILKLYLKHFPGEPASPFQVMGVSQEDVLTTWSSFCRPITSLPSRSAS